MSQATATRRPEQIKDAKGTRRLEGFTPIPDAIWLHLDEWRRRGWKQHVKVYRAACKAAALGRYTNAEKLCAMAVEMGMGSLGSKRRVQIVLAELQAWGFLGWQNLARLHQYHTSRIVLAGRHYPIPKQLRTLDYLQIRHADMPKKPKKTKIKPVKPSSNAKTSAPKSSEHPRSTPRPVRAPVLAEWRPMFERHKPKLVRRWQRLTAQADTHLDRVWPQIAAIFEEKGYCVSNASRYLDWLARSPAELEGAKFPLLVALQPDRLQRWLGINREFLRPCATILDAR